MDAPGTGTGVMHAVVLGLSAAIVALLIAYVFPSIIPAKAAATRL